MDWITKEQVQKYATTPERAMDIAIRHHQQIVDATEEELDEAGNVLSGHLCGLCLFYYYNGRHRECGECPLVDNDTACNNTGSLYLRAHTAYHAHPFSHKKFIKADRALLNHLKQLKSGYKKTEQQKLEIRIKQAKEGLQEQLLALAKPELRHGDYGFDGGDAKAIAITDSTGRLIMSKTGGLVDCQSVDIQRTRLKDNVLGNIFDDLAALAEPLEEFKVHGLSVKIDIHGAIQIRGGAISACFTKEQDEYRQKLNQVFATAKRKAAKT
jgi:hypothetical protein